MGIVEMGIKKENLTIADVKILVELVQSKGGIITHLNAQFEETP